MRIPVDIADLGTMASAPSASGQEFTRTSGCIGIEFLPSMGTDNMTCTVLQAQS